MFVYVNIDFDLNLILTIAHIEISSIALLIFKPFIHLFKPPIQYCTHLLNPTHHLQIPSPKPQPPNPNYTILTYIIPPTFKE